MSANPGESPRDSLLRKDIEQIVWSGGSTERAKHVEELRNAIEILDVISGELFKLPRDFPWLKIVHAKQYLEDILKEHESNSKP